MDTVLTIIFPVFGLVLVGYAAARAGLLAGSVSDGLSSFVFTVAVPCLLFKTLATADMPHASPWGYWAAYFSAVAVVWLTSSFAVRTLFRRDGFAAVVAGFSTGQGNTVMIGIPLILIAYGDAGKVPIFLLLAVHLPLMMTLATLAIELTSTEKQAPLVVARKLAVSILSHPIVIGILLGVLWRFASLPIPAPAMSLIQSLGSTAVPLALFSAGMALRHYGIKGDVRITLLISFLKLMVHPALYYVMAQHVFHLPPVWVGAGVLFAACPTGINAYLLASRYGQGVRIASSAIALSTMLAVLSVTFWLLMLGIGGEGALPAPF